MDVYLIRHPEPEIAPGICYGQLDIPARPGFESAIERQAARIPENAVIYTSPLQRCAKPAQVLARAAGRPLQEDPRLMEMNFGDWEGRRWDDLRGPDVQRWMADYVTERTPGGESFMDLQSRITQFFTEVLPRSKMESTVPVVVTHAGVIRSLQILWAGLSPGEVFKSVVPFAEVICFRAPDPD